VFPHLFDFFLFSKRILPIRDEDEIESDHYVILEAITHHKGSSHKYDVNFSRQSGKVKKRPVTFQFLVRKIVIVINKCDLSKIMVHFMAITFLLLEYYRATLKEGNVNFRIVHELLGVFAKESLYDFCTYSSMRPITCQFFFALCLL
jgi:hypothetical protein